MTTRDEYQRRRSAIKAVLDFAAAHPGECLPFEELPEVATTFRDRRELLLALQYDWSEALWAQVELQALNTSATDASELAHTAWRDCAALHPALRGLLDAHRDELGPPSFRLRVLSPARVA